MANIGELYRHPCFVYQDVYGVNKMGTLGSSEIENINKNAKKFRNKARKKLLLFRI